LKSKHILSTVLSGLVAGILFQFLSIGNFIPSQQKYGTPVISGDRTGLEFELGSLRQRPYRITMSLTIPDAQNNSLSIFVNQQQTYQTSTGNLKKMHIEFNLLPEYVDPKINIVRIKADAPVLERGTLRLKNYRGDAGRNLDTYVLYDTDQPKTSLRHTVGLSVIMPLLYLGMLFITAKLKPYEIMIANPLSFSCLLALSIPVSVIIYSGFSPYRVVFTPGSYGLLLVLPPLVVLLYHSLKVCTHTLARRTVIVASLLTFGILIRLLLAAGTFGSTDVQTWVNVVRYLSAGQNPYDHMAVTWPPLWHLFLLAASILTKFTSLSYTFLLKLPIIAGDILIALFLYFYFKNTGWESLKSLKRALLFFLCPITILISSVHGNFDPIPSLFVILALYTFLFSSKDSRVLLSSLFLGLGIALKGWPAIFLPVFLAKIPTNRERLTFLTVSILMPLLSFTPLIVYMPKKLINYILFYPGGGPYWWGFTGLARLFENAGGMTFGANYQMFSKWLLIGFPFVFFWKRLSHLDITESVLLTSLCFFFFTPAFGPQYMIWILPLLFLAVDSNLFNWFLIYTSCYYILDYGFSPGLGGFMPAAFNIHLPFMEAFLTQKTVICFRTPIWIIIGWWFVSFLVKALRGKRIKSTTLLSPSK